MTEDRHSHRTVLEWPDPVLGSFEIPIGEISETEVNPDRVKFEA